MKFKNLFYVLTILMFTACSSDEEPNVPDPKLKLTADRLKIAPFETLTVDLSPDNHSLNNNFDSVVWQANGLYWDGSIIIGGKGDDYSNQYIFTDYKLGKHKIQISGYKNDKIIDQDIIEYEVVKPTGDFFNLKWNQTTGTKDIVSNYVSPTKEEIDENKIKYTNTVLGLSYAIKNGKNEHAILRFTPWRHTISSRGLPDINSIDWFDDSDEGHAIRVELEHTFMHEYITSLYGSSQFIYEGDDVTQTTLMDEYNTRFNYERDYRAYPVEIWITPTTSICLLQFNDFIWGVNTRGICMIIAEPFK